MGTVLTVGFPFVICILTAVLSMAAPTYASATRAQDAAGIVALVSAQRNTAGLGGYPSLIYVERTHGASLVACDVDGTLAEVKVSKNLIYMGVTCVAGAWTGPACLAGETR